MTLRTLNYGNYGIFLTMGNAGFCPSTVVLVITEAPVLLVSSPSFAASDGSSHHQCLDGTQAMITILLTFHVTWCFVILPL